MIKLYKKIEYYNILGIRIIRKSENLQRLFYNKLVRAIAEDKLKENIEEYLESV